MKRYRTYLKTLRRVPDDVILAVAGRPLNLGDGESCLCGWFVREALARIRSVDATEIRGVEDGTTSYERCTDLYGGSQTEWYDIYAGVADEAEESRYNWTTGTTETFPNPDYRLPDIERAFVERMLECVP